MKPVYSSFIREKEGVMPVSVDCPNCGRKLRIEDDLVGKKVRCPDCKTIFLGDPNGPKQIASSTAPSTGVSAAGDKENRQFSKSSNDAGNDEELPRKQTKRRGRRDDEDDDDDDGETRRLKPSEARAGWRWTRLGVMLTMYGLHTFLTGSAIVMVGFLFYMILGVVSAAGRQGTVLVALTVFMIILWVVFGLCCLAGIVLSCVGHGFFSQVPNQPDSGLRTLSIATMALWFGSLLLYLGTYAGSCVVSGVDGRLFMAFYSCSSLLDFVAAMAWFFVFWIFMRAVCIEVRDRDLARSTIYVMIIIPAYAVVGFLVVLLLSVLFVGGLAAARGGAGAGEGALAAFVLVIVSYFAYLIILWCLLLWASLLLGKICKAIEWQQRRA
jgi:predicted Zn finger-like uncharacterized protein